MKRFNLDKFERMLTAVEDLHRLPKTLRHPTWKYEE